MNIVILLLISVIAIVVVTCVLPIILCKLHSKAKREKRDLSRKIAEIQLLPQERYDKSKHTAMAFCTVCMDEFTETKRC